MSGEEKGPKSLDQFTDEKAQAVYEENATIARDNRVLRQALQERTVKLEETTRRLELFEALEELPQASPPEWLMPKTKKNDEHLAIPSLLITDVHWGERISPEEISDLNCYDPTIAEARVRRAAEGAVKLCRDYLSGVKYEGICLMLGGDLLSGDIHEELRETNVQSAIEGVVPVMEILVAAINLLADHFGRVSIEAVTGNHGRSTKKMHAKRRFQDNYDGLVYTMLARELADDSRVSMRVATGPDAHFSIYDTRYCLTHGDQFRGGSGISGALSPLMLGVHRKRRRDAAGSNPWDVMVLGHFHQSFFHHDFIVGGAVVGYNEFAYQKNYVPETARAALWLNTPERGITTYMPVHLQDREAEGW